MNLKKYRVLRNLTQKEVAKSLEVKCNTVSQWETGSREPNIENLKKLAALFGCTVSELIDEQSDCDA